MQATLPGLPQPPTSGGVVLLHGIARTPRSLKVMERALARAGFATLNLGYPSRRKPLQQLASDIHPHVERFAAGTDGPVHFVGHSMGGILARVYLARQRPANLGRVVMLGTPNRGSELADLLRRYAAFRAFFGPAGLQLTTQLDATLTALPAIDYPLGIVAGRRTVDPIASRFVLPRPSDGRVSVASTKLDGMTDHIVMPSSHPMLVLKTTTIAQTIAFLRHGRFDR
jgi:pimeloyl-ACP methyl ester carboxylesterase